MKFFLFAILLFITAPLCAQWNVGIKAGVNIPWINYGKKFDQNSIEQDFKLGYMGGLTLQYFNQPNIGIQMEVLYIQKGFKTKYDTIANIQYERNIDYISLPMLMHTYIGKKKFNFSILLGPFLSYAISSKEIFTEDNVSYEQKYNFDRDLDNRFEFGLQGGIGFRNAFNFGIIELEGIFSYSFTSIYKWGASNIGSDKEAFFAIPEQAQNQGIQITISYYKSFGQIPEKK